MAHSTEAPSERYKTILKGNNALFSLVDSSVFLMHDQLIAHMIQLHPTL
jgi:hypothetical protein